MSKLLTIPCSIEGISTRKDKTLKIVISTQELSTESTSELIGQWSSGYGVMSFKKEAFTFDDEEVLKSIKLDAEELGNKTPSQRLRAAMFVLFDKNPEGYRDFNTFYGATMEKLIDMVKKRIDTYSL